MFQPAQNRNKMEPITPGCFQYMNQGSKVRQRSSNEVPSGYHPVSLKLKRRGSFSLLRFFWRGNKRSDSLRQLKRYSERNKRNEEKVSSEPELKPYMSNTSSPAAEINLQLWQHFDNTCPALAAHFTYSLVINTLHFVPFRNFQKTGNTLATLLEQNRKNKHNFVPTCTKMASPYHHINLNTHCRILALAYYRIISSKNFSVKKFQF